MKHPICVGTDLSDASDDAIVRADALSRRDSVELTVVHAVSPLFWGIGNRAQDLADLQEQVVQRVARLTGRQEDDYRVVVERGLPHAVLARIAIAGNCLLVVGAHMHHGLGHALLRDVTERVVERARGPVLVTRPFPDSGPILVAIDRPFESSAVLDAAIEEARTVGCELAVLHCIDTGFVHTLAADLLNGGAYADTPMGLEPPVVAAKRALRAELAQRRISARVLIQEGEVQSLIPRIAARTQARLVVVGSGHSAHSPQVSGAVLRRAPCSVLVVDSASTGGLDRDTGSPRAASSTSTPWDAQSERVGQ